MVTVAWRFGYSLLNSVSRICIRVIPGSLNGTDWLAFGHIAIALFFVGPLIRPSESRSVLWAGIAACILVIPLALICGAIRGIPFYWRLIDCSFGVIGVIPLLYCLRLLHYIKHNVPHGQSELHPSPEL
jgi:hypothetical protein